jgi:hypothetical protein
MVWTNAVGVAFTATLLSVGDRGATFVFPEDGTTNTLALTMLSPESAKIVCKEAGFVPIPPRVAGIYNQCKRDLIRVDAHETKGRMSAEKASDMRVSLFATFRRFCEAKGVDAETIEELVARLLLENERRKVPQG